MTAKVIGGTLCTKCWLKVMIKPHKDFSSRK